jgi:hypothetical protein
MKRAKNWDLNSPSAPQTTLAPVVPTTASRGRLDTRAGVSASITGPSTLVPQRVANTNPNVKVSRLAIIELTRRQQVHLAAAAVGVLALVAAGSSLITQSIQSTSPTGVAMAEFNCVSTNKVDPTGLQRLYDVQPLVLAATTPRDVLGDPGCTLAKEVASPTLASQVLLYETDRSDVVLAVVVTNNGDQFFVQDTFFTDGFTRIEIEQKQGETL